MTAPAHEGHHRITSTDSGGLFDCQTIPDLELCAVIASLQDSIAAQTAPRDPMRC